MALGDMTLPAGRSQACDNELGQHLRFPFVQRAREEAETELAGMSLIKSARCLRY